MNRQQAALAARIIRRRLPPPACTVPGNRSDGPRMLGRVLAAALEQAGELPAPADLAAGLCLPGTTVRLWLGVLEECRVVRCRPRGYELHPSVVAQVLERSAR